MSRDQPLREFGIRPVAHSGLLGVFLGCHAIGDAIQVLHTGVGCKGKTQRHLVEHDLGLEAHAKVAWTELSEAEWIRAPIDRLHQAAAELQRRRRAGVLFVTTSAAVEYTGADLEETARSLEAESGVPVLALPGAAASPDLYAGFGAVVRAVLGRTDWKRPPAPEVSASLAGYFFHRHEHEQAANLAELKRLARGIGASLGPVLLSGEPLGTLRSAHRTRAVLGLPYLGLDGSDLGRLTRRSVAVVGLPLGVRATGRFLRELGSILGIERERVEHVVEREEGRVAPRLAMARRVLEGHSVAILADTPLAAGWMLLAEELGLDVSLVGLLDRSLGGEAALRTMVSDAGATFPGSVEVVSDPTLLELRARGGPLAGSDAALPFDLAVRPDLGLSGTEWVRIPTVEVGFPARHKHFVYPLPEMGYSGAVALAGRLVDALGRSH